MIISNKQKENLLLLKEKIGNALNSLASSKLFLKLDYNSKIIETSTDEKEDSDSLDFDLKLTEVNLPVGIKIPQKRKKLVFGVFQKLRKLNEQKHNRRIQALEKWRINTLKKQILELRERFSAGRILIKLFQKPYYNFYKIKEASEKRKVKESFEFSNFTILESPGSNRPSISTINSYSPIKLINDDFEEIINHNSTSIILVSISKT